MQGLSLIPNLFLPIVIYLITMWTVNTYSGIARLELLDTGENIAVHLRPPYLFQLKDVDLT